MRTDRLFREGWRSFYETLADHREGLGVPTPSLEVSSGWYGNAAAVPRGYIFSGWFSYSEKFRR